MYLLPTQENLTEESKKSQKILEQLKINSLMVSLE